MPFNPPASSPPRVHKPLTHGGNLPPRLPQIIHGANSAAAAAPPLLSVIPPWVRLDFAAFTGRNVSLDTAPSAGGSGDGGPPWGLITVDNLITMPQPAQAEGTIGDAARSHEREQRQVPHGQHASSPQVSVTAGGASSTVDASGFASSPLFEWVPYDGWDDSDLCQGQGGRYYRRDASGPQYRVTHRLRPGDLSGPSAATESDATTPRQTQSPGGAGGAVMSASVNGSPVAASPRCTGEISSGDLDAPQRGMHQQQAATLRAKVSLPALRDTVATDRPRGVWSGTHTEEIRGEGKGVGGGGGVGDAGGRGDEGFTATLAGPPPPLSSTAVAQGTSTWPHLQRQHIVDAAGAPSSMAFPGAASAAAAHRITIGVSKPFFLPIETVIRKALPVLREGFSSRPCSLYTGVRSDGTLSIVMLEEYPGYTESTPAQPSQATAPCPGFLATTTESTATAPPSRQTRQGWPWPPPAASAKQSALSSSLSAKISLQSPATAPQCAAACVAGATSPTGLPLQHPTGTAGAVSDEAAISDPCVGLVLCSPARATPTPQPSPPSGSGGPQNADSGNRADPTCLGATTASVSAAVYPGRRCRLVGLDGEGSPMRVAVAAASTIALRGHSVSSVPPEGGGGGQGHWLPLGFCTVPIATGGSGDTPATAPPFETPAVANAALRTAATTSAVVPESVQQTHLTACGEGAGHAAVVAVTTRREALPAPNRAMPPPTFNATESPSEGTTSPSLSAPQNTGSAGGGSDRQRSHPPETSLLPSWCRAVAEALLAAPPPPKLRRLGQLRGTSTFGTTKTATTNATTVTSDMGSRMWGVETRGGMPTGSTAKLATVAERTLVGQGTSAVMHSAVGNRRRGREVGQQGGGVATASASFPLPSCESAGPDVDDLDEPDPTDRQLLPPAPLKPAMPAKPLPVTYSREPSGVGCDRGMPRIASEGAIIIFDPDNAPYGYTQVLMEVESTHSTPTMTDLKPGDVGAAATADAAAAAAPVTRGRERTRNVQLSASTTLCRFQDYHQRRYEGASAAIAEVGADRRAISLSASVVAAGTFAGGNAKNNAEGACTLNHGDACMGGPSALPSRCRAACATGEKRDGHVSTIASGIGTTALTPDTDAAGSHTGKCGSSVSAPSRAAAHLTLLAPGGTEMAAVEYANEYPPQRRHGQLSCGSGAAAIASGYAAHKIPPYIMGECANAGYLRFRDVAAESSSAAETISLGVLVTPAASLRPTAVRRSSAVLTGSAGEVGGVEVIHSSGLVNTSRKSTPCTGTGGLGFLPVYSEHLPLFHMSPGPIEGAPMPSPPPSSSLQDRLQKQQPQGSTSDAKASSVNRVPTRPLAQHPSKLGRPAGHTTGCGA